jgi:chromosome partitioning protein
MSGLQKVLGTHQSVVLGDFLAPNGQNFNSYAVTNLRGGVGKSSVAFNLAFEMSRHYPTLFSDLCPQSNFTELLMGDEKPKVTIYDGLRPAILGSAFGDVPDDISYKVGQYCNSFKGGKGAWVVPGDAELFSFPSLLYQQLNTAYSQGNQKAVARLLHGLKNILVAEAGDWKASKILLDTSPFYAGGTHLAWCAVEALIVPVRVDEHSIESLELLCKQLSDPKRDFQVWNDRAGGLPTPKIAAVVMTMVGSKSREEATPDNASRMYIERAIGIAEKYNNLFNYEDPADAFVITEDFHSAGRISGAERVPITELVVNKFHTVEGRRLQVNSSASRYKKQIRYLASMI